MSNPIIIKEYVPVTEEQRDRIHSALQKSLETDHQLKHLTNMLVNKTEQENRRLEKCKQDVEEHGETIKPLQIKVAELSELVARQTKELNTLRWQLTNLTVKRKSLQSKAVFHTGEIADIRRKIESRKAYLKDRITFDVLYRNIFNRAQKQLKTPLIVETINQEIRKEKRHDTKKSKRRVVRRSLYDPRGKKSINGMHQQGGCREGGEGVGSGAVGNNAQGRNPDSELSQQTDPTSSSQHGNGDSTVLRVDEVCQEGRSNDTKGEILAEQVGGLAET